MASENMQKGDGHVFVLDPVESVSCAEACTITYKLRKVGWSTLGQWCPQETRCTELFFAASSNSWRGA